MAPVSVPLPEQLRAKGRRSEPVRMQLLPTSALTPTLRSELWDFTRRFIATSREHWEQGIDTHEEVILFRVKGSEALVGMAAVDVRDITHAGRRVYVIITSSVLIDDRYRGQNLIQRSGLYCFLRTRLRHPWMPIYWFFVTFSYKSYLLLARNFVEFWPRPGLPMPAWEWGLMDALARWRYGADWQPALGIARFSRAKRLKEGVAPIDDAAMADPHVRFFAERAPGHAEGDLLVCLAPLSARNWFSIVVKTVRRMLRPRVPRPSA